MKAYKSILATLFIFLIVLLPSISAFDWNNGTTDYWTMDTVNSTWSGTYNNVTGLYDRIIINTTSNAASLVTGKIGNALNISTANYTVSNVSRNLNSSFAINFWFNIKKRTGAILELSPSKTTTYVGNAGVIIGVLNNGTIFSEYMATNTYGNITINNDTTYMLTIVGDGTKTWVYVNGALAKVDTRDGDDWTNSYVHLPRGDSYSPFYGWYDEVGVWNRTLNTTDVSELYNGGSGLTYQDTPVPVISIVTPANATSISDVGTNFTVIGTNATSMNALWKNITYYVWYANGTIHNQTTITLNNQTINQILFIDDFTSGDYFWNVRGAYQNTTGTYYTWSANNFTFEVIPIAEIVKVYNPIALEGSSENFYLNVSIISNERLSTVSFIYNGTSYPIVPIEYATNYIYMPVNVTIPSVTANTNLSFYWRITLESGLVYDTTSINQTIYNIGLDNCSTNSNQIFNLTMRDETSQAILNGTTDNTNIKVTVNLDSINGNIVNYSTYYNRTNPARVCLNYPVDTSSLLMDAVIQFSSDGRFVEFYNIQNYVLTNTTQSQNISLYNLNSSVGQEYKITYKGLDFTPVTDLIVQIQRKYVDEGVFKTIEIPMSGTNGYTIAHLVTNDVIYNLIFIKDGVVLDTFTDVIATCQNPSFTNCEINLNALVGGTDLFGLIQSEDFFSSLSYNTQTRAVSSTFGVTSGVSGNTTLLVYLLDNFGNSTVCSDSLVAAGGTLTCIVPESFGNATVQAKIIYDGEIRNEGFISMDILPKDLYNGMLMFLSIVLFLFLLGIAIQDNPVITAIFLLLGVFILIGLNMIYSTTLLGAGATVLWFVIAIVMILIKGGNKR